MQDWSPKPLPSGGTAGPGKVEASAGQAPSKPAKSNSTTRLPTLFLVIVIPSMFFRKMFEIEVCGNPRREGKNSGGYRRREQPYCQLLGTRRATPSRSWLGMRWLARAAARPRTR